MKVKGFDFRRKEGGKCREGECARLDWMDECWVARGATIQPRTGAGGFGGESTQRRCAVVPTQEANLSSFDFCADRDLNIAPNGHTTIDLAIAFLIARLDDMMGAS